MSRFIGEREEAAVVGADRRPTEIGRRLARAAFARRGNRTQIHLRELELAILLAAAVVVGRREVPDGD